jgi:hypothetical protein
MPALSNLVEQRQKHMPHDIGGCKDRHCHTQSLVAHFRPIIIHACQGMLNKARVALVRCMLISFVQELLEPCYRQPRGAIVPSSEQPP